jgi:hypothetical protein
MSRISWASGSESRESSDSRNAGSSRRIRWPTSAAWSPFRCPFSTGSGSRFRKARRKSQLLWPLMAKLIVGNPQKELHQERLRLDPGWK